MNKDTQRQIVNGIALLITIVVNGLANALPLNGQTTGAISDRFPVYFVPAGYVFSIWGLIYLGLLAFGIYQALPSQRDNTHLRRLGYLFALSCVANSVWIFLWHYEFFVLTLVAMGGLLISLILIYIRLEIGRTKVAPAEKWLVHIPFSLYLGWITVATIANVTVVLYNQGWNGWGLNAQGWAVVMLIVATAIASAVGISRRDVAYIMVIVWAFVGILVKQSGTPVIAITAGVMALIVALVLVIGALLPRLSGRYAVQST